MFKSADVTHSIDKKDREINSEYWKSRMFSVFILALVFFAFFVMSDKEKCKDTSIDNEGLWERCSLFFMYVPFIVNLIKKLIS